VKLTKRQHRREESAMTAVTVDTTVSDVSHTCERDGSGYVIALRDTVLNSAPVEWVPLRELVAAHTPRLGGEDESYALALAESETELPPVLVHRPTMAVVDGVHRVRAARIRGRDRIAVRFFDGEESDAFPLAVAANVAHGRPLSLADRVAAAERIFATHPRWSDRAVAAVVGLSATKVSGVRREAAPADAASPLHRIGRDGRVRPLNSAHGRELASELLRADPGASLRQIARRTGISPATVADVRDRLRRGEDPVPPRQRLLSRSCAAERPRPPVVTERYTQDPPPPPPRPPHELANILRSLRRDPSLRLNDTGRTLLRVLEAGAALAQHRRDLAVHVPPHCRELVSELANGYAEAWRMLAEELR
jgi:hypothetical protein